jgi:hypothetical protein
VSKRCEIRVLQGEGNLTSCTQNYSEKFLRIKMSATTTSVTPLISLLEGSVNYESWARDVEMFLIGEDLWDHVDAEPATDAAA